MIPDETHRAKLSVLQAKILIVDDIPTNLRVAKELMAPLGLDIQTCLGGLEALTILQSEPFDLGRAARSPRRHL